MQGRGLSAAAMANSSTASRSPAASAWWASRARSRSALGHIAQCRENAGVEQPATQRRDGREDGFAGQFMAEGEPITGSPQHATSNTLVGFVQDRAGDSQQEVRLDGRADYRRYVEDRARLGREASSAGEDGIADGGGYGLAPLASTSVTKNGLPPVSRWRWRCLGRCPPPAGAPPLPTTDGQ